MLQYNLNASLITIDYPNKDKIELEIRHKSPLLVIIPPTSINLTIETMNNLIPGYIVNDKDTLLSLDQLTRSDTISIHKNNKMISDFNLQTHYSKIADLFSNYLTCGSNHYVSLYRGEHRTSLTKNYRETLLIKPVSGQVIIYLFNPKHESDIKGLELKSIKKWAIKLEVDMNQLLYIPPEWYYFYESDKEVILSHIETDSYSTFLFNYLRNK